MALNVAASFFSDDRTVKKLNLKRSHFFCLLLWLTCEQHQQQQQKLPELSGGVNTTVPKINCAIHWLRPVRCALYCYRSFRIRYLFYTIQTTTQIPNERESEHCQRTHPLCDTQLWIGYYIHTLLKLPSRFPVILSYHFFFPFLFYWLHSTPLFLVLVMLVNAFYSKRYE